MPTKAPPPSGLKLPIAISWPLEREPFEPVVGPGPPAVVTPALVSPSNFARTPRFNLSEMPRHHAVHPNTYPHQVVPGDPNVHPALREDAIKGTVAAAARAVRTDEKDSRDKEEERKDRRKDGRDKDGERKDRKDKEEERKDKKDKEGERKDKKDKEGERKDKKDKEGERKDKKDKEGERKDRKDKEGERKDRKDKEGERKDRKNKEEERKDRKDKGGERKDRRDKEGEREDRRDKEGRRKDRKDKEGGSDDRKHRERTRTEPHSSQTVETEPGLIVGLTESQKGSHKEKPKKSSKRKEKENGDILRLNPCLEEHSIRHLDDPRTKVEPSDKPQRSTSQRPQERIGSEALQVQQLIQLVQQVTNQTQTQRPTALTDVDLPCPSPTTSPATVPKPFPIHIILSRITTSKTLSPRQKCSLLTTLHGFLVDISLQTFLDLDLAQQYAKFAAQAAAVQNLVAEIEDPTPGTPVSLSKLKASGALSGYLSGTPGLGPTMEGSECENRSVYSQDGRGEALEGFLDEEIKGKSAGTGPRQMQ